MKNEVLALQGVVSTAREQILRLEGLLAQEREKQFHQEELILRLRQRNGQERGNLVEEVHVKVKEYPVGGGLVEEEQVELETVARREKRNNSDFIGATLNAGRPNLNSQSLRLEERLRNIESEFDKLIPNSRK